MNENRTPRELLLENEPDIQSEIDKGTELMRVILDNSVLNSTLVEYLEFRTGIKEVEESVQYRAVLFTLLFRSQGLLPTPEETLKTKH